MTSAARHTGAGSAQSPSRASQPRWDPALWERVDDAADDAADEIAGEAETLSF